VPEGRTQQLALIEVVCGVEAEDGRDGGEVEVLFAVDVEGTRRC